MATIDFDNLVLDDIIAEAERQHPDLKVGEVTFRNMLRIGSKDRDRFRKVLAKFSDANDGQDVDALKVYREALTIVADDKDKAEAMFDQVGDNLAVINTLVELYMKRSQVGEASPSQD
ncbi:phage tail assembly protein [Schaalia sp. ZJ1691]|uniref:phage tail assembly protein n=1 Tax=Schaalia sp. ZJ1691 TaxID=2709404 RepID=UPI0013EABA9A|nr:phage tail assembly protein [Schaalia sp. ZJ1691]